MGAYIYFLIEAVQGRKRKFLYNYQSTTIRASYERILGNFPQGILIVNFDLEIQFINEELRKFLNKDIDSQKWSEENLNA